MFDECLECECCEECFYFINEECEHPDNEV